MKVENLTLFACLSLTLGGCILVAEPDDDADDSAGFETDESNDDGNGDTEAADDEDSDGDTGTGGSSEGGGSSESGDTEGSGLECGDNLVVDPSFEAGSPSEMWTEASALFGTPLCDESCTTDDGAEPHSGEWWIWFGGSEEAEQASMMQTVTFDAEPSMLSFYFSINSASGAGEDVFTVRMDDEVLFEATDADLAKYDGYTLVEIDVSDFADGAEHELVFSADIMGEGLTNFFLDDVSLAECDAGGGAEESSSGGEESGSSDDSGTDTDAGETEAADTEAASEESGG